MEWDVDWHFCSISDHVRYRFLLLDRKEHKFEYYNYFETKTQINTRTNYSGQLELGNLNSRL